MKAIRATASSTYNRAVKRNSNHFAFENDRVQLIPIWISDSTCVYRKKSYLLSMKFLIPDHFLFVSVLVL